MPVTLREFLPDVQGIQHGVVVNQGAWQQQLEQNKQTYTSAFAARPEFVAAYPQSMTPAEFVDALNRNTVSPQNPSAGGVLSQAERDALIADLTSGVKSRAQVLRAVAEDSDLHGREYNGAFVLMQYFGYLRRNPPEAPEPGLDYAGYNFWLSKLNNHNGDFVSAEMVKAFITSPEYVGRFGQ